MRHLALPLIATALAAGCAVAPPPSPVPSEPFTVKLIGFNDYHGHLQSPGQLAAKAGAPRVAVGGADALASHVAALKAANPLNAVVGAGDFIGASPMISSLFHDEPSVESLNRIGVEFNAVGNHEFDRGVAELRRLQAGGCKPGDANSCRGAAVGTPVPFEGAKFQWLAANVEDTATGRTIFPAYGLKRFHGIPVAFIGMTLKETPTIVTPTGVAGLRFTDEAETANRLVRDLRGQGVQAIVVLLHQGGAQEGSTQDINACDGALKGSALEAIVGRLDDAVDLVISGHTHAPYICTLKNAAGRAVPATSASAFGRVLTDIDLTLDPRTRDITAVKARNLLVDRTAPGLAPSPALQSLVAGYERLVAPLANRVIGRLAQPLPNATVDGACNLPAGELIADAQLAATEAPAFGGAHMAFMNRGGVRNPGFLPKAEGAVTYGEAYTVQPFGNSLVTLTLSSQQVKDVLEQQFAGCRGQLPAATRLMIPSRGVKIGWDGAQACGERIRSVSLTRGGRTEVLVAEGRVAEPQRAWRVTVNSFLASGGDSFTTFTHGRDPLGGALDLDALVEHLGRFQATPWRTGGAAEDAGSPRLARVGASAASATCPTGAATNP